MALGGEGSCKISAMIFLLPSLQGEESKPLLPPAASPPNKSLNGTESNCYSLPSARTDEQALLSSILAKTAM